MLENMIGIKITGISNVFIGHIFLGYQYIYQEHRDISAENAEYTIDANDFIAEFLSDQEGSQTKYLNKTIAINGNITTHNNNSVTLNSTIFCSLLNETDKNAINSSVTVKGRFIGYDDLLEEIKLDQCSLIKTN